MARRLFSSGLGKCDEEPGGMEPSEAEYRDDDEERKKSALPSDDQRRSYF